jgi:succinyl-diaminopimelate desuccinylase
LYGRYGEGEGGLLFLGHVDVVPPGDEEAWSCDPFGGEVRDWGEEGEVMVGRGAVDMKGGVACYVAALRRLYESGALEGLGIPISFFVTSDEEAAAVNGAARALPFLYDEGERWDFCLNGEPTSSERLGDALKVGRRGSLHGILHVKGRQGHTGYVDLADNAVHRLLRLLRPLVEVSFDKGSEFFEATRLSVTSIEVSQGASNVIPGRATGYFNVRFNDLHTEESLKMFLGTLLLNVGEPEGSYDLEMRCNATSFMTAPGVGVESITESCREVLGITPEWSTVGGTSDSRFVKDFCAVADFGLCGKTMHGVDERVSLQDLESLTEVYGDVTRRFARKLLEERGRS